MTSALGHELAKVLEVLNFTGLKFGQCSIRTVENITNWNFEIRWKGHALGHWEIQKHTNHLHTALIKYCVEIGYHIFIKQYGLELCSHQLSFRVVLC